MMECPFCGSKRICIVRPVHGERAVFRFRCPDCKLDLQWTGTPAKNVANHLDMIERESHLQGREDRLTERVERLERALGDREAVCNDRTIIRELYRMHLELEELAERVEKMEAD